MSLRETIIDKVRNAGVVGAGGAGFPTHVKISNQARTIIANGAECEPLLFSDRALMLYEPDTVIEGLETLLYAVNASSAVIALKKKYKDETEALKESASGKPHIQFQLLDNYYPAGDEHNIVFDTTGRVIPEKGLPLDRSCIVQNIGTLFNVAESLNDIPVTSRLVTVTGAVKKPGVYRCPIGMPLETLIQHAGGPTVKNTAILTGGPMMGELCTSAHTPVMKTTSGVILLPDTHHLVQTYTLSKRDTIKRARLNCEQCRFCTDYCPRYLEGHAIEPHRAMQALISGEEGHSEDVLKGAALCSQCGICELHACPVLLSPRRVFREINNAVYGSREKPPAPSFNRNPSPPFKTTRSVPTDLLVRKLDLERYSRIRPAMELDIIETGCVRIPLKQHIGTPAVPMVKKGDRVFHGQQIGRIPEKSLGASVHASISGTVSSTENGVIEIHV